MHKQVHNIHSSKNRLKFFIREPMYKIKESGDKFLRFLQIWNTSLNHLSHKKANLVIIMFHISTARPSFHKFLNYLFIWSSRLYEINRRGMCCLNFRDAEIEA